MKRCPRCNQEKPPEAYSKSQWWCKVCQSNYIWIPKNIGVPPAKKQCKRCLEHKSRSEFNRRSTSLDGLNGLCRSCYSLRRKLVRESNPNTKTCDKIRHLKHFYKLALADYSRMLAEQQGLCIICGLVMVRPCVDHDHITCKVRGLLCANCNVAIGMLRDSAKNAFALGKYLNNHQSAS